MTKSEQKQIIKWFGSLSLKEKDKLGMEFFNNKDNRLSFIYFLLPFWDRWTVKQENK